MDVERDVVGVWLWCVVTMRRSPIAWPVFVDEKPDNKYLVRLSLLMSLSFQLYLR